MRAGSAGLGVPKRPSHPVFAKTFVRQEQGEDWGTPLASVCPLSSPPRRPWSPARERVRKGFATTVHRPPATPGTSAPTPRGSDSARSVYKPVSPSIYMLHRMYICWELARFSRVSPLCSPQHGALAGERAKATTTGPSQSPQVRPPVSPCPQLCPRFDRPEAAPSLGLP